MFLQIKEVLVCINEVRNEEDFEESEVGDGTTNVVFKDVVNSIIAKKDERANNPIIA